MLNSVRHAHTQHVAGMVKRLIINSRLLYNYSADDGRCIKSYAVWLPC